MTPAVSWYAEPLGFVVMLGVPLLVTAVWLGSEGWRKRRRDAKRLARVVTAQQVVAHQRQVVADLVREVDERRSA